MPSRNTVKTYVEKGYYHVYNRGVEKRNIFQDAQDYKVFLGYLRSYLSDPPNPKNLKTIFILQGSTFKGVPRQPKNYYQKIELLAFCLIPNHFHLLLKQNVNFSLKGFMQSLSTRYSMYFNKKYKRVGPLFQGIYKASLIKDESYLLHLSRYIHLNPQEYISDIERAYSSYQDYLGKRNLKWLTPKIILSFYGQSELPELKRLNTYQNFVERYKKDSTKILGELTLEV